MGVASIADCGGVVDVVSPGGRIAPATFSIRKGDALLRKLATRGVRLVNAGLRPLGVKVAKASREGSWSNAPGIVHAQAEFAAGLDVKKMSVPEI